MVYDNLQMVMIANNEHFSVRPRVSSALSPPNSFLKHCRHLLATSCGWNLWKNHLKYCCFSSYWLINPIDNLQSIRAHVIKDLTQVLRIQNWNNIVSKMALLGEENKTLSGRLLSSLQCSLPKRWKLWTVQLPLTLNFCHNYFSTKFFWIFHCMHAMCISMTHYN